ncbi:DUF7507 domain-containing protein [Psychromicrobium xiongbiense]|uniref:DUF7507 domain-containing protein n=1 Tax=Psychromicrobium xiongbiense TaxID=3051184 RepID=UPI0025558A3D|nr:hypothetical protein [Psychromicrobium sp. YIM S02556]
MFTALSIAVVGALTLVAPVQLISAESAQAAGTASCNYAKTGTGTFADTLCWLDLSNYNAQAASTGQDLTMALPGGSTMTFTLTVTGGPASAYAFPTWSGAYLGNNGHYSGVAGKPALYQTSDHTTTVATLSNIKVIGPTGKEIHGYALVGADAESTDVKESITWTSDTPINSLTANGTSNGLGNACAGGFTGVGTRSVTCTGAGTDAKTGTAILAATAPTTFTQTMVGGGREGIAFGVLVSQLQINKKLVNRFTGDNVQIQVGVQDPDGTQFMSAQTGPTGTTATAGPEKVVVAGDGTPFTFGESALSGNLDNYDASWSCTRNGQQDSTLPSGEVGTSATVNVHVGDAINCTVTNSAKPTGISLVKKAGTPQDANGDGLTDAGDTIGYTFAVTNTGKTALNPVTISDAKAGSVSCPAGNLAPGDSETCTADKPYTITSSDQSAGKVNNTATATGTVAGTQSTVTSQPSSTSTPVQAPAPGISMVKSASPSDAAAYKVGQTITYSFVVTDTGNVPLNGVHIDESSFSGTGTMSALQCPSSPLNLAPQQQVTCTTTYQLTQADIDAGKVTNTASATGTPPGGAPVTSKPSSAAVPVQPQPGISLLKSASPAQAGKAGDTVTYTFHVTNTGNVTLKNPTVKETAFSGTGAAPQVSCPAVSLEPGQSADCNASYVLTQADVDAGQVTNTATASATPPSGTAPTSAPSSAKVTIDPAPALALKKSADPATVSTPGEQVTYHFVASNTGNVTLQNLSIAEGAFSGTGTMSAISCPATTVAPGQSVDCTASYAVTQADIDAGNITNSATASATPPGSSDPVSSPRSDAKVTAKQNPALSLKKSADPATVSTVGQQVTYTFVITNTGNVTLTDPTVTETAFSGTGSAPQAGCPRGAVAPGDSVTCYATYQVTQADIDAGTVTNTATASADPPNGAPRPTSDPSSAQVSAAPAPALSLVKSASPDTIGAAGEVVTYHFLLSNTGNVTLHDLTVQEGSFSGTGALSPVSCEKTTLEVGAQATCTATYTVTQADADAGAVSNTATANGTPPATAANPSPAPVSSAPSAATVKIPAKPGLSLVKTADATQASEVGQVIHYQFVLRNTGNVTLTKPGVQEGSFSGHGQLSPVECPQTAALEPGQQLSCTASYTVQSGDLTGQPLSNTATAHGKAPGGQDVSSDPASVSIPSEGSSPALPDTGLNLELLAGLTGLGLLSLLCGIVLVQHRRKRRV